MKKNKIIISKKHIVVVSDFNLPLKMFNLTDYYINEIKSYFPNIQFIFTTPQSINNDFKKNDFGSDATIYWGNLFNKNFLDFLPNLKWIHFGSVGTDNIDIYNLSLRKIKITNSPGIIEDAMVSSILAYMTNLARGFFLSYRLKQLKKLNRENWDKYSENINDFYGMHILIVGYGSIGSKLASICKAFRMKVSAINRSHSPDKNVDHYFNLDEISKPLSSADFVINLLPLTKSTADFFSIDVLSKMHPKSFFINIGRGGTVVEKDLIFLLKKKKICAAALDVYQNEPLSDKSPLFDLENIILTPHVAGYSNNYWKKQVDLFLKLLKLHILDEEK